MHKYQWLLFDADGTLYDFERTEIVSLQKTIEQGGYPYQPHYLAQYKHVNDQLWEAYEQGKLTQDALKTQRFALFLEAAELDGDPAQWSATYLANLAQGSYLLPGAESLIASVTGHYHIGIITNGIKEVQRSRFEKSAIFNVFETIIVSGEIGIAKPEPGIFDAAFAAMGMPDKRDVLIIGDSLSSDMQGGCDYGIDTCWYNPDKRPRTRDLPITYEIGRLSELAALLA